MFLCQGKNPCIIRCPTCKKEAGGAHKCGKCGRAVHALPDCSDEFPGQEEKYGSKRICKPCSVRGKDESTIEMQEMENWGGVSDEKSQNKKRKHVKKVMEEEKPDEEIETVKKKKDKKSFYLRNDFSKLDFANPGERKAEKSILKNANRFSQKTFSIDCVEYSLINTCAFDAIFQILLKVMRDPALSQDIGIHGTDLLRFIKKVDEKGSNRKHRKKFGCKCFILFNTILPKNKIQCRIR